MKFLRIAIWNANGLAHRRQEIELLITVNKLDILLISETHFTNRNYFALNGYSVYTTQHPDETAHGGTAIIINNRIKHHELPEYKTAHLQATAIQILDWQGALAVSAVYCPPRHKITRVMFSDYFKTLGNRFIAAGDWNSKHQHWGSRLATPRGRELKICIDNLRFVTLSTGEPTYWPTDANKIPDLLDFFIVSGISKFYFDVESCLDGSSDHSPVVVTVSTEVIRRNNNSYLCNSGTDWEYFGAWLEDRIDLMMPLKTKDDIDLAAQYLTTLIQAAAWSSTNSHNCTESNGTNYPREIMEGIAEKRRLRRVWQLSRHPADKTAFNKAAKDLKEVIREVKNESFKTHLESLSTSERDDYSLWKATKRLKRPQNIVPPIKNSNGDWARSDKDKADLFGQYLEKTFKPHPSNVNDDEINEFLDSPLQMSLPIKSFTRQEITKTIYALNLKKAPGYDLLTAKLLQKLPEKVIAFITMLFNGILRTTHYPSLWKVSQIIMIPKPGKPVSEPSSYRPISLLPILSKVFEKLFLTRLMPILEEKNVIPDHQFGFRNGHSTVEQVHRVINVLTQALEKSEYCSAAFLDVQMAFDKVWHAGLLYKLKMVLPQPYFLILKSYLEGRFFQVKFNDELSAFYDIESGVPQGSVLGPILYSIFTSDLPETEHVTTATFADDTATLACNVDPVKASRTLQKGLDDIQRWLSRWRIKVNPNKSYHVTFSMRRQNCPNVILENIHLPQVNEVRYLGMHLDRRLNWKSHIKKKRDELNIKFRKMYWLLGRDSALSVENKLLIYKVILKPVWTYGVQLWGTASKSNVEILQRFQNKVLRNIINAPWYTKNTEVYEYLSVPLIKDEISKFNFKYQQRLNCHQNVLAVNLLNNSEEVRRLKRHHILDLS